MRFLIASDFDCDQNAGSAGSLLDTGSALSDRGHEIDYLWRDKRPYRLPHPSLSRSLELPRRQFGQIAAQMSQAKYDVVLISQPYAYLAYERLPAKYPQTLFLNITFGWEDRFNSVRAQFEWNGPYSRPRRLGLKLTRAFVSRACARTVRACHGVISASQNGAMYIRNAYHVAPEKVTVIPTGLSPIFLRPTPKDDDRPAGLRLLYVGNYLELKGSGVLESILPPLGLAYPDTSLTFVVPGSAAARIRSRFGPAFGNRLTVLSWRERDTLPDVYARHDILLFPSLFEGFGRVFLEAMACGVCVVGFGEGGLPDIATSGVDALYCAPGELAAMRALLERCLQAPAMAREIGLRARQTARKCSMAVSAEQLETFCARRRHASAV